MIENDVQYETAREQAAMLEAALTSLASRQSSDRQVHPLLLAAERDGARRALEDLRRQIATYESHRAGERTGTKARTRP